MQPSDALVCIRRRIVRTRRMYIFEPIPVTVAALKLENMSDRHNTP